MSVTPIRPYPKPDEAEMTEIPLGELTDKEFRAAMRAGFTPEILKANLGINPLNQDCLDKEEANPQTRNTYGRK